MASYMHCIADYVLAATSDFLLVWVKSNIMQSKWQEIVSGGSQSGDRDILRCHNTGYWMLDAGK